MNKVNVIIQRIMGTQVLSHLVYRDMKGHQPRAAGREICLPNGVQTLAVAAEDQKAAESGESAKTGQ